MNDMVSPNQRLHLTPWLAAPRSAHVSLGLGGWSTRATIRRTPPTGRQESVTRRFCRTALSGYRVISDGRRVRAKVLGPGAL